MTSVENTLCINNLKKKKFLLFCLFIPFVFVRESLDNDIWFLLNSGRYVLENGIPFVEPFTIHEGFSFVMQQWLTALLYWLLYANLGTAGLFALIVVCYGLIITVTYKLCTRLTGGNFLVSYGVTFLISAFVSSFMITRPYMISALVFALEAYLLESFIATGKKGYLFFLPVLSLAEINFHAAMWPMLFVVLVPYWIDAFSFKVLFVRGQGYPKKTLLIVTVLMVLAGFVNPYGTDAMLYLFRSYGYSEISNLVMEMKPANINDLMGKWVFGTILFVTLVYALYRKGGSRLRYILLTLGMAYLAISSVRGILFFSFFGVFPLSYYLRDVRLRDIKIRAPRRLRIIRDVLTVFVCAGFVIGLIYKYGQAVELNEHPEGGDAVQYLLENADPDTTVLYTGYNTGGYAEYMGFRCYIDPRAEVFVKKNNGKEDVMQEYYRLQNGDSYYRDFLDKYRFTYLMVSSSDALYIYLPHDSDYEMVYEDSKYRIYVAAP